MRYNNQKLDSINRAKHGELMNAKQAIVGKRQLDARRLHLEGALEDLRRRTAENERLDEQTKLMRGELVALRELADGRGLELRELREKMARYPLESAEGFRCFLQSRPRLRRLKYGF